MKQRRGRPPGSRTSRATPAMKRAREYFEMKGHKGYTPMKAAKFVAAKWGVTESTVFKDWQRHFLRLYVEQLHRTRTAQQEWLDIIAGLVGNRAAQQAQSEIWLKDGRTLLERYPDSAAEFLDKTRASINRAADELEGRLRHMGDVAAREKADIFRKIGCSEDYLLQLLGQVSPKIDELITKRFFTGG